MSLPAMLDPSPDHAPEGAAMLSDKEFRQIAAILYEDSGIRLPDGKASLVYSRLAKRLRALGLQSFKDYCALIRSEAGISERQAMLSALTTNVTRFFREPHHFEALAKQLRSGLAARAKAGGRVRLWSAGCSSGEEPYSMAMTLLAELPEAPRLDVKILATDIDPQILAKARTAQYGPDAADAVPAAMRRHMGISAERGVTVSEDACSLIAFRELNLMADWPIRGKFDVIFCRNVAIYFEEATQERLWDRFAGHLARDGRLYIGHSERVASPRFESVGLTAYCLAGAAT